MAKKSSKGSTPLTFDLPVSLISTIDACRRGRGLKSSSEVVRLAIEHFDFESCKPVSDPHRQISVRVSLEQRAVLKRYAKKKNASVGELLRLAIEGLPPKAGKSKR
jgi:hypothetical protein